MLIDARYLPAHEQIETDICIVGGGVAGMTLARELAGQPFRVCILESGGMELDDLTQTLAAGENVGYRYFPLDTAYGRCFGGSSNRWHIDIGGDIGVRFRPLDAIDFEKRDCVPYSGWPIDRTYLDPFYERAQAVARILPPTFEARDWTTSRTPVLPLPSDRIETIVYKFPRQDTFRKDLRNEVARAENITVYLGANVTEIETDSTGESVQRVRVASFAGPRFSVNAKLIILAANGLETPRLLLVSNRHHANGLGNQHDLVGRFFMEHLHFWSGVFLPSRPDLFDAAGLYKEIHNVNGVAVIGKLALTQDSLRKEKLLNQNIQLFPYDRFKLSDYPPITSKGVSSFRALFSRAGRKSGSPGYAKHLGNIIGDINNVVAMGMRRMAGTSGTAKSAKAFVLANMVEQIPNPDSRVTLGTDRDGLGVPRVRLDWKINPEELRSAIRTQEILDQELHRAGLGRVSMQLKDETPPLDLHGGYHQMGTTRMHVDARQGVVDANTRVHGVRNLFITGPSVFPTGGYANPTLTVMALAIRLADYLKKQIASRPAEVRTFAPVS